MAKTLVSDLVRWRDEALKAADDLNKINNDPAYKKALNENGSSAKSVIIDAEYKLKDYARLQEDIMRTT